MQILTLDVETTIFQKGNPFSRRNKLVMSGVKLRGGVAITGDLSKEELQQCIDGKLIVGFNLKFDLHWIRRKGVDITNISVWDCQLAEFMLECQTNPYNSLDDAAIKYGFPVKLNVVKTEYWDKGIDTDAIPKDILREYLEYDLSLTEMVFREQYKQFKGVYP